MDELIRALGLAPGTVITGALTNDLAFNRSGTMATELVLAVIDLQRLTKITRLAGAVHEILESGAAGPNGLF